MRFFRWLAGFFETHAPPSMVRLTALLCCGFGGLCAVAGYDLAHRPRVTSEHVAMVHALAVLAGVFIGGGLVALLTRTRSAPPTLPQDGP